MRAKLKKWYKRRKKGQSESFRKVMHYVEPSSFHEDNLFSPESDEADSCGRVGLLKKA